MDLARRLTSRPQWRWMPGMRWVLPTGSGDAALGRVCHSESAPEGALPDLTDPATRGCLLAWARELWEDPYLAVVAYETAITGDWRWRVEGAEADVGELYDLPSEEDALADLVFEGCERQPDARGGP
jgi:hypothetical protein